MVSFPQFDEEEMETERSGGLPETTESDRRQTKDSSSDLLTQRGDRWLGPRDTHLGIRGTWLKHKQIIFLQ